MASWFSFFLTHIDCYGLQSAADATKGAMARWPDESADIVEGCRLAVVAKGHESRLKALEDFITLVVRQAS